MSGHGIDVCACGEVIRRCRCIGPHEPRVVQQSCPKCAGRPKPSPPRHADKLDVARLRALLEKATPGLWAAGYLEIWSKGADDMPLQSLVSVYEKEPGGAFIPECEANAKLIAALRNAAPELLRRAEEWGEMRRAMMSMIHTSADDDEYAAVWDDAVDLLDRIAKREGGGGHG